MSIVHLNPAVPVGRGQGGGPAEGADREGQPAEGPGQGRTDRAEEAAEPRPHGQRGEHRPARPDELCHALLVGVDGNMIN